MNKRIKKDRIPISEQIPPCRLPRTDLALEEQESFHREAGSAATLPGVELIRRHRRGIDTTILQVQNEHGAKLLKKPVGKYTTLELTKPCDACGNLLHRLIRTLAGELAELMKLKGEQTVLVVGLGNESVSYDALGPLTLRRLLVTGNQPQGAPPLRRVTALEPGVFARTGIESVRIIRAVVEAIKPELVLCVDSLATREETRLCSTIQLTDTGLIPGSGVGLRGDAVTAEELGVPVYAIGVPTVVDASDRGGEYVITPRLVHELVTRISRLIAGGINLALHSDLTLEQITHFVDLA